MIGMVILFIAAPLVFAGAIVYNVFCVDEYTKERKKGIKGFYKWRNKKAARR